MEQITNSNILCQFLFINFLRMELRCAKFLGSCAIVDLVTFVSFYHCTFLGRKLFSRGYFGGLKFFLVGISWVRNFVLVFISWVTCVMLGECSEPRKGRIFWRWFDMRLKKQDEFFPGKECWELAIKKSA